MTGRNIRYYFTLVFIGLVFLSSSVIASSIFNRSYSTLEQSATLKGDFDNILRHGKLRILLPQDFSSITYLPRKRSPLAEQQRIAEEFALSHGLTPELVLVDNFSELIPALVAGKGDVIINNLTINEQRRKEIAFSVPVMHVKEQIVVKHDDTSIASVQDLNGKVVMVNRDSTFWHALLWLKNNKYPDIDLRATPDRTQREQVLDMLVAGEIDATVLDSNLMEVSLGYRNDIKVAANFSGQRDIGWGVRKDAPRLVAEINRYLHLEHQVEKEKKVYTDDFEAIKKRRVIRVMLRNNAASYFLYRGQLLGFEYELAKEFARYHGLRLEVVVSPSHEDFSSWLLEGKADIAMAFLEPNSKLEKLGLNFSEPYHQANQHIVVKKNDSVSQLSDLEHRSVVVRQNSAAWERLSALQRQGGNFKLRAISDDVETEQLIQQVAQGEYQATLADEHILNIELVRSVAVKSAFALDHNVPHAIALRATNPELKQALDAFVKRVYKGELYNVLYSKYFKSRRSVIKLAKGRVHDTQIESISPYDNLVQKYAEQYGFDWRLITAQMYQESRFNPKAKSPAGARGLMQIMPRTADSLGFSDVETPATGIQAGVKYMDWLRDRFDKRLPLGERLWFTLAAYNAGAGHVHDARRLAQKQGLDPDRWFGNTETAMLMLSKKKYASQARYGFVRGEEPVKYVRGIKQRFEAYTELGGKLVAGNKTQEPLIAGLEFAR